MFIALANACFLALMSIILALMNACFPCIDECPFSSALIIYSVAQTSYGIGERYQAPEHFVAHAISTKAHIKWFKKAKVVLPMCGRKWSGWAYPVWGCLGSYSALAVCQHYGGCPHEPGLHKTIMPTTGEWSTGGAAMHESAVHLPDLSIVVIGVSILSTRTSKNQVAFWSQSIRGCLVT